MRWLVPSMRIMKRSLTMRTVVKSTRTEKMNVQIGSAILYSGCKQETRREHSQTANFLHETCMESKGRGVQGQRGAGVTNSRIPEAPFTLEAPREKMEPGPILTHTCCLVRAVSTVATMRFLHPSLLRFLRCVQCGRGPRKWGRVESIHTRVGNSTIQAPGLCRSEKGSLISCSCLVGKGLKGIHIGIPTRFDSWANSHCSPHSYRGLTLNAKEQNWVKKFKLTEFWIKYAE